MSAQQTFVHEGTLLMDRIDPSWFREIDLEQLDLWDCYKCVLGQRFGGFLEAVHGLRELGVDLPAGYDERFDWMVDHGFESTRFADDTLTDGYANLTQLWRREILERRKQAETENDR